MPIVCGTDFTEASAAAVTVASQLAAKMHVPLHLVHSVDLGAEELYQAPKSALVGLAEVDLRKQAERLRRAGVQVEVHVKAGAPDEALRTLADELAAQLIVVGALGQRRGDGWQLGSHADRTAQRSHIPVLVVRNSAPFEGWANGTRPLRVVLGVDASLSSEVAGHWISDLSRFGRCEVVLAHLYWPPEEFHRLGLGGVRSWVEPDAEVTRTLEQEYSERFAGLFTGGNVTCRLEPHLGRLGDGLAALATEEKADLIVVGSHNRGALARLWEGSVSQRVLRSAQTSVACIPAPQQARSRATPAIVNVLAATDFSTIGDAAVPLAYSIVGFGGTVHLLHVLKAGRDPGEPFDIFKPTTGGTLEHAEAARAELAKLIPKDGSGTSVATRVHVIEAPDVKAALCQAAERLNADVICLGTHGRSGVSRALLGSVAESVLANTRRPVLLARAPIE
jgi:nucleotide-binding universal stress UspA family protein